MYFAQQSMEDATKALATLEGFDHRELIKFSHNNLSLFIYVIDHLVNEGQFAKYIDILLSDPKSDKQLGVFEQIRFWKTISSHPKDIDDIDEKRAAENFCNEMLLASPMEVITLLSTLPKLTMPSDISETGKELSSLIDLATEDPFLITEPAPENDFSADLTQQIMNQLKLRLSSKQLNREKKEALDSLSRRLVENDVAHYGEDALREIIVDNEKYGFVVDDNMKQTLLGLFNIPSVLMNLWIVGGLTWPHESYPRYVAPPNAPVNIDREALSVRGPKPFGSIHYTNNVGVVMYIKPLACRALYIAKKMRESYDIGHLSVETMQGFQMS